MSEKWIAETTVPYADVDRRELMLLPRVFKMLQDVAIAHANQFGTGTQSAVTRGETWVLNRIAVGMTRYPRADEPLRIETWSSGIKGFKGYREFRVFDAGGADILRASSLWLYVSTKTKAIVRVPRELAALFPVGQEAVCCPDLETFEFVPPAAEAIRVPVSLRYSDFDVNEHMNNAAYLDLVQSALAAARQDVHPLAVRLKYAKAIPVGTDAVDVRLEAQGVATRFSVERDGVVFAVGEAAAA